MSDSALEQAKHAWQSTYDGFSQEQHDRHVLGFAVLVRGIAERGAVSSEELASEIGVEPSQAKEFFARFGAMGAQLDEQGRVVGAALTTRKTPHRIAVGGKQLFAWCSLDTLLIPGLLGKEGEVESRCPVSGDTVRVSVAPDGVADFNPAETVLSIVLPSLHDLARTGPASPT